jgi:hypothetical protein
MSKLAHSLAMRYKQLRFICLLLAPALAGAADAPPAALSLACPADSGTATVAYSASLKAGGGVPPYKFSISQGALPGGLTLDGSTGAIIGKPTAAASFSFTAKVVDSLVAGAGGAPNSKTADCAIVIATKLTILKLETVDSIEILKDKGGAAATTITNPVWTSAGVSEPFSYPAEKKMKLNVTFKTDPKPGAAQAGVTITGDVSGLGKLVQNGVTIPAQDQFTVDGIEADTAFAKETKLFKPMKIAWSYSTAGRTTAIGDTSNPVYIPLRTTLPGFKIFLTTLTLAVADGGATDSASAFRNTWGKFSMGDTAPADVKGWDNRPLRYYEAGANFARCTATGEEGLLQDSSTGQCGSFADLLEAALKINEVAYKAIEVENKDGLDFMVQKWTFQGAGTSGNAAFPYKFEFNAAAGGVDMVPKQAGDLYGEVKSDAGIAGQNSPTPSEKVFSLHYITRVDGRYYDASYGVKTAGPNDFEDKAVSGYLKQTPGAAANVFIAQKSAGLKKIKFK